MTPEEKAKAYDKALKVVKDNLAALNEITETGAETVNIQSIKNCFYKAFPELKEESEDETIRKCIVLIVKQYARMCEKEGDPCEASLINDALAYLEKQKEQEEPQVYKTEDGETITYSETEGYKVCDEKQQEQNSIPSREMILRIWELGNFWKENKEARDGLTQLRYIQKYWDSII